MIRKPKLRLLPAAPEYPIDPLEIENLEAGLEYFLERIREYERKFEFAIGHDNVAEAS
ncbi:MAG: hypothetical protein ACSLE1_18540 [Sphingobium sp.]